GHYADDGTAARFHGEAVVGDVYYRQQPNNPTLRVVQSITPPVAPTTTYRVRALATEDDIAAAQNARARVASQAEENRHDILTARESITALGNNLEAGDRIQSVQAGTANEYQNAVNVQQNSATALIVVGTADFTATIDGASHAVATGDVIYFAPRSTDPERLFTLPQDTGGGGGSVTPRAAGNGLTLTGNTLSVTNPITAAQIGQIATALDEARNAETAAGTARTEAAAAQTTATTALGRTEEFIALSQFVLSDAARTLYFYGRPLADQATGVTVAVNIAGSTIRVTLASAIEAATGGVLAVPISGSQAANIHRNNPNNVRVQLTTPDGDTLNAWVHSTEPDLVVDATARRDAAAARSVADAATTPTEATNIANSRAAARYTDAEKQKVSLTPTFTQITQAAYDALAAKDPATLYLISG
ncbi:MAG: hypothetical protein OXC29_23120, partial [Rhodococcus sp.]|nr:hypothetical protein [Rhodococcus sp. (in: high G+C Gram-positive bacteria)]